MSNEIQHDQLEDALQRCGASWDAAQSHGLLASRLAVGGSDGALAWLQQVLAETDSANALAVECQELLGAVYATTWRQLSERQSEFALLLPDEEQDAARRATALAHWCEGFLHGLVAEQGSAELKERLAAEPLADIIKDLLQITRAAVDEDEDPEESEAAYSELVEYIRVAAQLVFEELAELRDSPTDSPAALH